MSYSSIFLYIWAAEIHTELIWAWNRLLYLGARFVSWLLLKAHNDNSDLTERPHRLIRVFLLGNNDWIDGQQLSAFKHILIFTCTNRMRCSVFVFHKVRPNFDARLSVRIQNRDRHLE